MTPTEKHNYEWNRLKELVVKKYKDNQKGIKYTIEDSKITVEYNNLIIQLVEYGIAYDYWIWYITLENENQGKCSLYITSDTQWINMAIVSKHEKITLNSECKSTRVDEDLLMCKDYEVAIEEIEAIINRYEREGILALYTYYMDFLEPALSYF